MLTQQENIISTCERVHQEALTDLESEPEKWMGNFHPTLKFSDEVDDVVRLWQASLFGYAAICNFYGISQSSFKDYQTRFKGVYLFPQDFFDKVRTHLMTDFAQKYPNEARKLAKAGKLERLFDEQIEQRYYSVNIQWVVSRFDFPELESLEHNFLFRR